MRSSFESVWEGNAPGAWLLAPLGALYAVGWWAYQSVYAGGLKRAATPAGPVVTVGNLVAGGTGKTPLSLATAALVQKLGRPVVLGMSGYGSPQARGASMAPVGELTASEWGDEPAMARWLEPTLPLVVGRDRVEAARLAFEACPEAVLVMDDGFQHLRLEQRNTVVLDPPRANQFCLPAGPYREPRSTGRRRASLVLPSQRLGLRPTVRFWDPARNAVPPPAGPVSVVAAIARPHRLVTTLEAVGATVREGRLLPDHDRLDDPRLLEGVDRALPLVTTAKDWVKLRERPAALQGLTVVVTDYTWSLEPESAYRDWLKERLGV
jgi:tetraacyldisaccharide 4'-kinase